VRSHQGRDKFLLQEINLESFKAMYPHMMHRLKASKIVPDRVTTVRRGMKNGPIIGQVIKAGSRYYPALCRDNILAGISYRTLGFAVDALDNIDRNKANA